MASAPNVKPALPLPLTLPTCARPAERGRCHPGAASGQVEDEQGVCAGCRGLTRKEANRMIVAGFFQQICDLITIESVREALGKASGRRIREYD